MIGWTEEMDNHLRENFGKIPTKELAAFLGKSGYATHKHAKTLSIPKKPSYIRNGKVCYRWTDEDTALLIREHRKKSTTELGVMLKGRNWATISKKMQALGLRKRMDHYEGKIWIRRTNTGSFQVKIFKDGRFQMYGRWLWEQKYGPVPKDKVIVSKDGNPLHCNHIENLVMITRRLQLLSNHPLLTKDEAIAYDIINGIKDNLNIKRRH